MTQPVDRTAPLVSLEEFRRAFNFMPWHFWGLANGSVPVRSACETLIFQYAWQHGDSTGRDDILTGLMQAEARLKEQLGFAVRPQYESEEIAYPQFFDLSDQYLAGIDALGRWMGFSTRYAWAKTIGLESRTLLETPTITYSDEDGDGLQDTFTITATVPTGTTAEQIAVYVPEAERFDETSVSERWRIRPVRVSVSGTTATIRGAKWLCVRPVLYERTNLNALDPADNATNMLATMDVYRYAADTTQQGRLLWETMTTGCCGDGTTDPSAIGETPARYVIRDARRGFIAGESAEYSTSAAGYIATEWPYCWQPQKIEVNYRAGWHMDDRLMLAVCRLAAAEMGRPICACREANREYMRWQADLASTASESEDTENLSFEDLNNPFGTRRGQLYAWRVVQELRQVRDAVTV